MTNNDRRPPVGRSVLIVNAAGLLGVSRRTVYYRIREGKLQTIRTLGGSQRVLWSSIEALRRETYASKRGAATPNGDPASDLP